MDVARKQHGSVATLVVRGAMTAGKIDPLGSEVDDCVDSGIVKFIFDLEHVPLVDSAGLEGIQVLVSNIGKHGGDVRVTSLNDVCRDIFLATRMEGVVRVCGDHDEALKSLL